MLSLVRSYQITTVRKKKIFRAILFRVIWKFQVMVFTKAHEGERVISPSGFHYLWFATKCTFDPFRPFISNPRNVRFVSNLEGENCTGDLSRKGKLLFYLGSLELFFFFLSLYLHSLEKIPWRMCYYVVRLVVNGLVHDKRGLVSHVSFI